MKKTSTTKLSMPKQIHPNTGDSKYLGNEPLWPNQPAKDDRNNKMTWSFAWYNYFCSNKEARQFTIDWLSRDNELSKLTKDMARVPDRDFPTTLGWLCRMSLMGWQFDSKERDYVGRKIHELITKSPKTETKEVEKIERPNIQDHLRAKMVEAAGTIEGMFDDMVTSGCKFENTKQVMNLLRERNIAPQMVAEIAEHWQNVRSEFQEAADGRDADLVEGYAKYSKLNLRNMIKFADQVIADCGNYVQVKKVERKPRKKKPISPEKATARFKYLKEFAELKLTSQPVTDLVNAQEAWLYDTKKRKLIHVVADELAKTFTVKGSAIIGYDTVFSMQKTLRKPKEQLKALLAGGAPAARKVFKDIKATETKFNGRGSENMILLKIR